MQRLTARVLLIALLLTMVPNNVWAGHRCCLKRCCPPPCCIPCPPPSCVVISCVPVCQPYCEQPTFPYQPAPHQNLPYEPQPYQPQPHQNLPYEPQPYQPQPYQPQPYQPQPRQDLPLPVPIGQNGLPAPTLLSSTVQIDAPRNAVVQVQGQTIDMGNGQFTSSVANLMPGKTYRYSVQAQLHRDGQVLMANRQVTFRAGQPVRLDLRDTVAWERPTQRPETGLARVNISAPEGVAIYLQGKAVPLQNGRFAFNVTNLTPGKTYHYTFVAQVGQSAERIERRIGFTAGNQLQVEFTRSAGLQASAR